jgi:ubiquinone/menaquinone biosynthesis C-methylase UbiE
MPVFASRPFASFLKLFFQLLYHQFAWTYDGVAAIVSLGRWQDWVVSVLPYLPGPRVLEIGFGPGHLQAAMAAKGLSPFGLDESWQMASLSINRLVGLGFSPLLVNGYAQFMPFPSAAFNQIVATFPSEYIYSDRTIAELYRLLAPGGSLVLLPVAWIRGPKLPDRLAAALFRVTGQAPDYDELISHQLELSRPFERAGFAVHTEMLSLASSQVMLLLATK